MNKTSFDPSFETEEFLLKYLSFMGGSQDKNTIEKVCEDHKDHSLAKNEAESVYINLFKKWNLELTES